MSFYFKIFFIILFIIGFYKIAEDLYNAIKIKKIINELFYHLAELSKKIGIKKASIGEHLLFLNKNYKLLNTTDLYHLRCQSDPHQPLLSYLLLNFSHYTKFYMQEDLKEFLRALMFKAVQIHEDINIWSYIINFINPIVYFKKSIHCILNNFYSLFPFSIPKFLKITLELSSIVVTILISVKTLSPEIIDHFIKLLFSFINMEQ